MANTKASPFHWLKIVSVVLLLIALIYFVYYMVDKSKNPNIKESTSIGSSWPNFGFLDYIFGEYSDYVAFGDGAGSKNQGVGDNSAIIITIAIWFFIFLTFGDIITTFSTFSKEVSWSLAFIIAVIVANMKGPIFYIASFIELFSYFGIASVILGAVASFVAFVVANWAIGYSGIRWVIQRQRLQAKLGLVELADEAGAKRVSNFVKGAAQVEGAFRNAGSDVAGKSGAKPPKARNDEFGGSGI